MKSIREHESGYGRRILSGENYVELARAIARLVLSIFL